jgi:hypothetical protein
LVHERWRRAVDRIVFLRLDRPALVHRVPGDIEHPSHDTLADWNGDGPAGIRDLETAFEAFCAGHGNGPDPLIPEVLLNFEYQLDGLAAHVVLNGQCVVNRRNLLRKFNVDHRTYDLNDFAS